MSVRIAMDLEFYATEDGADDSKLIQLGYCIFDTESKKMLHTGGDYIKIDIPLSPYIITLTGITQKDIDEKGISVLEAVNNMNAKCIDFCVDFYQFATWGSGDVEALLTSYLTYINKLSHPKHSLFDTGWKFGTSYLNLKAVYQAQRIQNKSSRKGGLKKSCTKLGLEWQVFQDTYINSQGNISHRQRSAHDARCDALNTARIYLELFK